jgi:excisionase family DNA binding protein
MHPEFLRARDVACRLGIHVRTVWRWAAAGELPAPFRLGRTTRWRRRDIDALLSACPRRLAPRKPA